MTPQVFISFSKDDMPTVNKIKAVLTRAGMSPFVATEVVMPAQHLSKKIEKAIDESDAFVVLLTENSVQSPWVHQEIGYAKSRLPIIPIKASGVKPPALLEGCDCVSLTEDNLSRLDDIIVQAFIDYKDDEEEEQTSSVCDDGPHLIEPGTYQWIQLDVSEGDRVAGNISETDGDEFDWYILSEKNLIKFKNGEEFRPTRSGEDKGAYIVNWPVKGTGPWYLVIQVYGKKNSREVSVDLRT
jgi:hypothetical protein